MYNLEYLKNKKETWEIVLPFPVTIMDGFLINTSPKNYASEATKNDTISFERNDQKSLKSVFFLKIAVLKFSENLSPEFNETIALSLATNFQKSFRSVIFRKMFNRFP